MFERVVYFSLDSKRKESFYGFLKEKRISYRAKFSFLVEGEDTNFLDPQDLVPFIEKIERRESLHVIIDYISCYRDNREKEAASAFRDIILMFPEVQFLFDETFVKKGNEEKKCNYNFLNFLFCKTNTSQDVLTDLHAFCLENFDEDVGSKFVRMLNGCNNTYDASNLRHAIRKYKFDELCVSSNYERLQDSRHDHAAVVVEEEYHQNMFNSYCLYVCGYRVFPITTATELLWINKFICGKDPKPLLVRDYDLQFIDEDIVNSDITKAEGENEIDYIRGAKIKKDASGSIRGFSVCPTLGDDQNSIKWGTRDNPYWNNFDKDKSFFVTKGGNGLSVGIGFGHKSFMKPKRRKLRLRGIKKPMEGIYASIRDISDVKERYRDSRVKASFKTNRIEGDHSCPLNIYMPTRAMVQRAAEYRKAGCHRLAAIVASEALLLLNGFHRSLMNKAYYIQSVSENAMAMNLLGGNEETLKEDVRFRLVKQVSKDVSRMIPDRKDRKNLLYNIFNDCRLFCLEKEYFEAADEALSALVYEKERIDLLWLWYFIKRRIKLC